MKFNELRPFIITVTPRRYIVDVRRSGQTRHWMLLYVSGGTGEIRFGSRRPEPVSAGSAALLPPDTGYHFRATGEDMTGTLIEFDILPDMTPEDIASARVDDAPCFNEPTVVSGADQLAPWMAGALDVYMRREPMWQIDVAATCMRSLNLLSHLAGSHTHYLVDQVIEVIAEHYNEALGNSEIAHMLGKHPNYINAVFVRDMGMSIHQYVMRYRIEKAGQLLLTTQKPVSEVAREVGFRHFSHFSNCFHKMTGYAPATYRLER